MTGMRDRLSFTGQLLFTLLVAAFLVVPAGLSIAAGVTVNYFRGIQSGVTLQWVAQVFDLYADTRTQNYGGVGDESARTDAAASATRGQVATYEGDVA